MRSWLSAQGSRKTYVVSMDFFYEFATSKLGDVISSNFKVADFFLYTFSETFAATDGTYMDLNIGFQGLAA